MRAWSRFSATPLVLVVTVGGVLAQASSHAHALSAEAEAPHAGQPDASAAQRKTDVQRLQRTVAAQETKRHEAEQHLREQDKLIGALRRQLQTSSDHDRGHPR